MTSVRLHLRQVLCFQTRKPDNLYYIQQVTLLRSVKLNTL